MSRKGQGWAEGKGSFIINVLAIVISVTPFMNKAHVLKAYTVFSFIS